MPSRIRVGFKFFPSTLREYVDRGLFRIELHEIKVGDFQLFLIQRSFLGLSIFGRILYIDREFKDVESTFLKYTGID